MKPRRPGKEPPAQTIARLEYLFDVTEQRWFEEQQAKRAAWQQLATTQEALERFMEALGEATIQNQDLRLRLARTEQELSAWVRWYRYLPPDQRVPAGLPYDPETDKPILGERLDYDPETREPRVANRGAGAGGETAP